MSESHRRTVEAEFTRQAETFAGAPALQAKPLTVRLAETVGPGCERVLDLACGPGLLVPHLAPCARVLVGVDLTAAPLVLARARADEHPSAHFVRGSAELPPFARGAFDAVVARLALHHMEEPGEILRGVRELLAPEGRLIVLDILTSPDRETAELHDAVERLRDPSHVGLQSADGIRAMIAAAGYEVERFESFELARPFGEWAQIIADARRMASLELVLRHLARAGRHLGIDLREEEGELRFTYTFALVEARLSTVRGVS